MRLDYKDGAPTALPGGLAALSLRQTSSVDEVLAVAKAPTIAKVLAGGMLDPRSPRLPPSLKLQPSLRLWPTGCRIRLRQGYSGQAGRLDKRHGAREPGTGHLSRRPCRRRFLETLGKACDKSSWRIPAWRGQVGRPQRKPGGKLQPLKRLPLEAKVGND